MKGFVGDIFVGFIIFGLVPTVFLVIMTYVGTVVQADLGNVLTSNIALAQAAQAFGNLQYFNTIIPVVTFMVCFSAFIYGAFLKASPVTWAVGFVFLILYTYISFYISNLFYTIVTSAGLQTYAAMYPNPIFLIQDMPVIVFVLTCIYLVIGITKWRSGGFATETTLGW